MTEYISVPHDRIFPANLFLKGLCLVEPLTFGAHAEDAVSAVIQPEQTAEFPARWSGQPGRFTKIMVQFNAALASLA